MLAHFLRETIGLTGTHVGCVIGECGACSVLLDGKVVKSCLHFAVQADGREITTIEGLAKDGELNPVQEAFVKNYAFQCGYCTPGMVMTSHALLAEKPQSIGRGDPQSAGRQSVHVHRLCADRRRGERRGKGNEKWLSS